MTKTKIARITRISPRNFLIDCAKIFHLSVFRYAAKICRAWQCIKSVRARCQITKSFRCNRIAGSGCKMCVMCSFLCRIHLSISFPGSKRSITLMHVPFQCAINIRPRALVVWYYFTLFYVFIKRLRSFLCTPLYGMLRRWKCARRIVHGCEFAVLHSMCKLILMVFKGFYRKVCDFEFKKVQTSSVWQSRCAISQSLAKVKSVWKLWCFYSFFLWMQTVIQFIIWSVFPSNLRTF